MRHVGQYDVVHSVRRGRREEVELARAVWKASALRMLNVGEGRLAKKGLGYAFGEQQHDRI